LVVEATGKIVRDRQAVVLLSFVDFVLFMIARDTSFVFSTNVRLSFKNEK
jgi:hypothetical protein